jgi:hypothetical protein
MSLRIRPVGCIVRLVELAAGYRTCSIVSLDVVVLVFPVMMAVARAKEPSIAGRAAIRVLKQHMVKEPMFEAAPSLSEELFLAAIGTIRDLSLRSGFVRGEFLCWGALLTGGKTASTNRIALVRNCDSSGVRVAEPIGEGPRRNLHRLSQRLLTLSHVLDHIAQE